VHLEGLLCTLRGDFSHTFPSHFHGESRFEPRRFGKTSVTSVASAPRHGIHGIFRKLMFREPAKPFKSILEITISFTISFIFFVDNNICFQLFPWFEVENRGPLPSVGSAAHSTGECRPCAWHHGERLGEGDGSSVFPV
jgi:hypothetical protein